MEKDNTKLLFKLKLSKLFSSSCKTQDISEVIDHQNPIFTSQLQTPLIHHEDNHSNKNVIMRNKQQHYQQYQSSLISFPSPTCKPRCPESFDQMVRQNCIITTTPRRKVTGKYTLLSPAVELSGGRRCPPASPASPLDNMKKKGRKKRKKPRKGNYRKVPLMKDNPYSFSSSENELFSSDDERESDGVETTDTLFSSAKSLSFSSKSISLSSDDSEAPNPVRVSRRGRGVGAKEKPQPKPRPQPKEKEKEKEEVGVVPLEGKVKDTFAVVKSSNDPYNDFRTSMVEMIIEKQIFGAKELEQLLHCFLSLNSRHHHRVIVEVFTEIWDALFSHLS